MRSKGELIHEVNVNKIQRAKLGAFRVVELMVKTNRSNFLRLADYKK